MNESHIEGHEDVDCKFIFNVIDTSSNEGSQSVFLLTVFSRNEKLARKKASGMVDNPSWVLVPL